MGDKADCGWYRRIANKRGGEQLHLYHRVGARKSCANKPPTSTATIKSTSTTITSVAIHPSVVTTAGCHLGGGSVGADT